MASITVRNLPDETVERLKQRAKANNRSLEAEIRELLHRAAEKPTRRELRETFERFAASLPPQQTDSGELQAEGRKR